MVLVIGSSIDPSALRGYSKTIPFGERVAQSVEHLTFNQEVAGSIPAALTNKNQWLQLISLFINAT
jgi:hypothetical protein